MEGIKVFEEIVKVEPKTQQNEILFINVSGLDTEAAFPFNLFEAGRQNNVGKNT